MGAATDSAFGPEMPPAQAKQVQESVQKREKEYEARRGPDAGFDWARLGGNIVSPQNVALTAAMPASAASLPVRVGAGIIGGALGAATEPTSTPGSVATGAAAGGFLSGAFGAFGRWITNSVNSGNLDAKAAEIVTKRLASDVKGGGPTATEAIEALNEAQKAGKPMALADVGGSNVKGVAGYVARQPGESKNITRSFLTGRDEQAANRLSQDVAKYVHGDASMRQTTETLLAARSTAARPLYSQAETLEGVWSPRLQEFIAEPRVKRGLARGYELERLDALAEGRPFDASAMGIDLDREGNVLLRKVPNLRVLDLGKRGLDAMIAEERDPITGRLSAMGRSLDMVRHAYVAEIDDLDSSGVYKAARAAWAGPSKSLDALRFGRTIFNRNPEETAAEFTRLSPNDQEFARLGVADMLRERIAKTGFTGDESRAIVKNAWTREQLKPILKSDEEFNKFVEAVMSEHTMAGTTKGVLGGSQTAERLAEDFSPQNRAISSAMQAAWHGAKGNFPSAILHAWRMKRDLGLAPDPKLNEAVAKLLFSADPKKVGQQLTAPPPGRSAADRVLSELGVYSAPSIGETLGLQ
jgi:hypothetical protein